MQINNAVYPHKNVAMWISVDKPKKSCGINSKTCQIYFINQFAVVNYEDNGNKAK